ncbi:MAG TPA: hypothetical protein VGJ86_22140 [Acidimicrobiales bacterium]|jgi:putative aminopeptidase FrvX
MARHIQSAPEQHKRRVQIDRITVQLLVKIGEECEAAGLDQGDIVVETRNRSIGPATLTNALTGCPAGD